MSATPLHPVPATGSRTQADIAYAHVRDLLLTLRIPPGEPLSEAALMAATGVGRTPLREALNRLADERLVAKYARRGTFATRVAIDDLGPLTDLRVELEGLAAAQAALRGTGADRQVLLSLMPAVEGPAIPAEQLRLDTEIHRAVYTAAHNPFLTEAAERYHNLSIRIWHLFIDRLDDLGHHVEEHRALIGHILAGEPDRAREVAHDHVRGFADAVRALR
ncbi:GntR family transcriptional regulator [soil metagenome]